MLKGKVEDLCVFPSGCQHSLAAHFFWGLVNQHNHMFMVPQNSMLFLETNVFFLTNLTLTESLKVQIVVVGAINIAVRSIEKRIRRRHTKVERRSDYQWR